MNTIDDGKCMETNLITWKAKIYELARKVVYFRSKEKILRNVQDLNMPIPEVSSRTEQLKNKYPTEVTPPGKNIDNGFVDMRAKYVLRTRVSWTGIYGKESWPRERRVWEKV